MNVGYLVHQAERPTSEEERRAADIRRGELALALSRLLRRNRVPRGRARLRRLVELVPTPVCQPEPVPALGCIQKTTRPEPPMSQNGPLFGHERGNWSFSDRTRGVVCGG
jgi:hypothetical protein